MRFLFSKIPIILKYGRRYNGFGVKIPNKSYMFSFLRKERAKLLLLQERLELSTSAFLSLDILGEGTDYKYGALTDCATGAASRPEKCYNLKMTLKVYSIHSLKN